METLLEIAVDSVADALAAAGAGADRIELCTFLDQAGLSATPAMVRAVRAESPVPIAAMVRPDLHTPSHPARGCGFVHDDASWRTHLRDAEALLEVGSEAIVFGALTADGLIDSRRCAEMVRLARARQTVFHRAFDLCEDVGEAIDRLADAGVTRILSAGMTAAETTGTLGLGPTVAVADALPARLARLAAIGRMAAGRIELIGCGGVRAPNAAEFVTLAALSRVHSAARVGSPARFSADEVRRLRSALSGAGR